LHWDGIRWRQVPIPSNANLFGVRAITSRNVWAVGAWGYGSLLALHWNGRRWRRFVGPILEDYSRLLTVAAVSARDVWAGGEASTGNTVRDPIVYHWNGRRWQIKKSPFVKGGLRGIAARSAHDLWAVAWDDPRIVGDGSTIAHWNGKTWRHGKSVPARYLGAIASDGGTHVWTVGSSGNPSTDYVPPRPRPLIERYGC
jgi:hypothetical protein